MKKVSLEVSRRPASGCQSCAFLHTEAPVSLGDGLRDEDSGAVTIHKS